MSILAGVDAIVDRHLGVEDVGSSPPHHRHRASALRLSEGRPDGFLAQRLLEEAYVRLADNLARSPRFRERGPSPQNWRFEKQLSMAAHNASPETTLERAIASTTGPDWANQVPAASGLWDHLADKRRAVDLVHRRAARCYELIELKVTSDTPVRAAVEIVEYGLLYLLAREHYPPEACRARDLLLADEVHLRVLAPATYFEGLSLGWLEDDLHAVLPAFASARLGRPALASFAFEAFPAEFRWPRAAHGLVEQLQRRARVWASRAAADGRA